MTPVPKQIGPYRILSVLGEGGMGTVYLAEQDKPVRRRVALKVIKSGMDSSAVLRRFEAERQALAMMEHSSIARVYQAGTTERGQPYFAMEYVKGDPITEYCDSEKMPVDERLRLFCQVCSGVQHAHQKGVIHRDLTPGNVLVTTQDGEATPKIIDFGVARAMDHRLIEATLYTEKGQIIGTPEYMSPEQAGLDSLDVDTRSDVYTLGVLLYELLVAELPFSSAELREAGLSEMERKIREDDPPKPSTRVTASGQDTEQIAELRSTDRAGLTRRLKGDLDWIVMKALEKNRTRRYQTAIELAEDIERHLADEPVLARPPSLPYRTGKFIRRYRGLVIAATALLITLLTGIAGTTYFGIEARAGEERASVLASGSSLLQVQQRVTELYLHAAWPDQIVAMERWLADAPQKDDLPFLIHELQTLRDPTTGNTARLDDAESLEALIEDLELFWAGDFASIEKRLEWARHVGELTRDHPDAQFTWEEAREAIARADGVVASALYGEDLSPEHPIDLEPQMGLVPLGMNSDSGFWEFYHLRSALDPNTIPRRNGNGDFEVTEETGIIFVLIPGGGFVMGAQRDDQNESNYDPAAKENEEPRDARVEPFFLAKHEMTQAQWLKLSRNRENPSIFHPGRDVRVTLAHPVDNVSWDMCQEALLPHGLRLPDGAEWEYACRAGTTMPWSSGNTWESLVGHAHTGETPLDGYQDVHAPVGQLSPNNWGLFDMHGNVIEWCQDPFDLSRSSPFRMLRGGAFNRPVENARSSRFVHEPPVNLHRIFGLRAARDIQSP